MRISDARHQNPTHHSLCVQNRCWCSSWVLWGRIALRPRSRRLYCDSDLPKVTWFPGHLSGGDPGFGQDGEGATRAVGQTSNFDMQHGFLCVPGTREGFCEGRRGVLLTRLRSTPVQCLPPSPSTERSQAKLGSSSQ